MEVVDPLTKEQTVWEVSLLVASMKPGANVDPMARVYSEAGVCSVQGCRVVVE